MRELHWTVVERRSQGMPLAIRPKIKCFRIMPYSMQLTEQSPNDPPRIGAKSTTTSNHPSTPANLYFDRCGHLSDNSWSERTCFVPASVRARIPIAVLYKYLIANVVITLHCLRAIILISSCFTWFHYIIWWWIIYHTGVTLLLFWLLKN